MTAKSAQDRLRHFLRRAGGRAQHLRSTLATFVLLSIVSISALYALSETDAYTVVEESDASSVDARAQTPQQAGSVQPKTGLVPAAAHAEESRYRALAGFLSRKYKVSERVILDLVGMAHTAGRQIGIDPLLIIAVMAVESRFNPIAESVAGAKGLMQVIPKYHIDKLQGFGGEDSVFDPQTNILVGTQILKEYIKRTGSLNVALQMYAGALDDAETIYTNKVMTEKERLQQVVNRRAARPAPPKERAPQVETAEATPI